MADDSDDKTEEPTGKKLQDAKDNGQIGRSMDLSSAALLLAGLSAMAIYSGDFVNNCMGIMREYFAGYAGWEPSVANLSSLGVHLLTEMIDMLAPILAILMVTGIVVNVLQVGVNFTSKPLEPNFARLFSISNLTRLFGKDTWIELLKSVIKIVAVGFLAYKVVAGRFEEILYAPDMEIGVFAALVVDILVELLIKIIMLLLVIGVADFFYQKWKTRNDLKMSKNEVKDEAKNSQGDPKVQSARRRAMLKMHQQFMMKEVPKATVVITNPTHLAIALRYDRGKDQVPFVVAKGHDKLAEKIKQVARDHDVAVVENKPLARAMYDVVEVGEALPQEFFAGVAEVLAFVFNSRQKNPGVVS